MRYLYLLSILLAIPTWSMAQRNYLEEPRAVLLEKIEESPEGPLRIRSQLELARSILYRPGRDTTSIDSAISYVDLAEKASRRTGFKEGIVNSMVIRSLCLGQKGRLDAGLVLAKKALAYAKGNMLRSGVAESYLAIGQCYLPTDAKGLETRRRYTDTAVSIFRKERNLTRLASALIDDTELCQLSSRKEETVKLAFEALNVNTAIGNKALQGVYYRIAVISNFQADYPDAIKYNLLAIRTAKAMGDSSLTLCYIYRSLAATYYNMRAYRQGVPYALLALKIAHRFKDTTAVRDLSGLTAMVYTRSGQFPKALPVLRESMKWAKNEHDRRETITSLMINFDLAKRFGEAEVYARELRGMIAKLPPENVNDLRQPYNYLAGHYMFTNQLTLAYHFVDMYAAIAYREKTPNNIRSAENIYYKLDSIRGDYRSAFKHYQKAQRIIDSVDNITKAYQIALLNTENDTGEKNSRIDALNKQAQISAENLKRNRLMQNLIGAGALALLIITMLIYSRYRLKQRSNILLLGQKTEIDLKNVALEHLVHDKNQLLDDKDELLVVKDGLLKDKDLLIREVNYRVKNNLQIVMSLLQSQYVYLDNKQAQDAILEGQNRVRSVALIHDQLFRTDHVTRVDLLVYVSELLRSLNHSINKGSHKVKIRSDVEAVMLDVSQALPVGLILNEAVTNALKYAFPGDRNGEISVKIKTLDQQVMLTISDNGVGVLENTISDKTDSLGMTLIRGLAAQLEGRFELIHGHGLTVMTIFPIASDVITGAAAMPVTRSQADLSPPNRYTPAPN